MAQQILAMGNFNVAGICHAISCQWVKQSRALGDVTAVHQLGSPMAMFMNWQLPADWHGINENYHLPQADVSTNAMLDGAWLAEQCTRLNGFALIVLWGGGISVARKAHDIQGHTVAVRKDGAKLQYFDPNIGTFQFDNSLEMFDWLPTDHNGPVQKYPTLRNRTCEFVRV